MAGIKRANTSGITKTGTAISDVPDAPTIGTATASALTASVTFTQAVTGGAPTSFTVTSSPGSLTGTGASAPITVSGLTDGTSYTFTATATNSVGTSPASSASNSITAVTPMEGAYDSLATVTLATAASSITFTGIPTGYKNLQISLSGQETVSGGGFNNVNFYFNTDNGSGNYAIHSLSGDGSTAFGQTTTSRNTALIYNALSTNTSIFGGAVVDISEYSSTTKNKTFRALAGVDFNGSGRVGICSGVWMSTAAITSITLTASNFTTYTSAALYGVK
jgi:hypothetical protein